MNTAAAEKRILRDNPCTPDCPKRGAGCAIGCAEWAAFVAKRQEVYAARAKNAETPRTTTGHLQSLRRQQMNKKDARQRGRR